MIQRRQPIKRTPLVRKPKARAYIARKPIKARGRKAERESAALDAFRAGLAKRSGGRCEGRTPACQSGAHAGSDPHHIEPSDRDFGVHDIERGKYLCRPAHRWVHEHPALAKARGLLHSLPYLERVR